MELTQLNPSKGQICTGCARYDNQRCGSGAKQGHVDVLFIAEQPDETSANRNIPLSGHSGKVVRSALAYLQNAHAKYKPITVGFTYAVQCQSLTDTAPGKEVMHQCLPNLQSTIRQYNPKIIVALGASALRQLGTKQKYNELRNRFIEHYAYSAPIYVSFSEKALMAAPGIFETFKLNLINIFERIINPTPVKISLDEISKDYLLPKTMDEALAACDIILSYTGNAKRTRQDWHISVDTETTTLYPEKDSARIIAFCFGYDVGKAATILYDHPHVGEEYLRRLPELREKIALVLASEKPKVFHNAKFDLKFIELKYNLPVNCVAWDTLLGEHLLDEDKKGNYGLKVLTANLMPKYVGYEDKLYDLLQDSSEVSKADEIEKEIEDLRKVVEEEHPDFIKALEQYHLDIGQYERDKKEYDAALHQYAMALENFEFQKSILAGKLAVWALIIEDWPKDEKGKSKRGKPKKPVKWFAKPTKPSVLKEPKKPADPRSKKEQKISSDAGFENLPLHDLQVYGAVDGDVTRQLGDLQRLRINKEKSKVVPLMRSHGIPASRVLGRMEYGGTRVDQQYITVLEDALSVVVQDTERELYGMVGRTTPGGKVLNLNHAGTLGSVLYNWGWTHPDGTVMGVYPVKARTKTDQPSTSEKILRQFVAYEDDNKKIPTQSAYFVERLLKYRKASKALNTFLANTRALSKRDGFLHTQFHLNGTGTGRLSSSDMNMQNLPKYLAGWNIKKLFIPDDDSYVICNVDYKGAEVRVFTAYAHDEALIAALNDGLDMHSFFAHKVFQRPYEMYARRDDPTFIPDKNLRRLLDIERSNIKRVVFGILYGAGPDKIAETIGIAVDKAQELIDLLYAMFPEIKRYASRVEQEVELQHYVETHFGRRRRFPLAGLARHAGRSKRQARNFKVQSTSSDIVVGQLIEMDEPLRRDIGGRMLLTVHDSLVFQWPKKYISQLNGFVAHYAEERVRQKYSWLPVPFKADVEIGDNYGECQSIEKYLAKHPLLIQEEGIVEENELLTELRLDAFEAA